VNINSRLQWRFKPVSDLFIVYTDNYFAETNSHGEYFYLGQPQIAGRCAEIDVLDKYVK